jgi:hypothetical protein
MIGWAHAFRRGLLSGSSASIVSSVVLAICGRIEGTSAAGPNNGPSQWVWGERAAHVRRLDARHTLVGYLIHHLSSIWWATLHEKHFARPNGTPRPAYLLGTAAATAAIACFFDYQVAPRRLRPGFEKQLSRLSLFAVYTAFAVGLAVCGRLDASKRFPAGAARSRKERAPPTDALAVDRAVSVPRRRTSRTRQ